MLQELIDSLIKIRDETQNPNLKIYTMHLASGLHNSFNSARLAMVIGIEFAGEILNEDMGTQYVCLNTDY